MRIPRLDGAAGVFVEKMGGRGEFATGLVQRGVAVARHRQGGDANAQGGKGQESGHEMGTLHAAASFRKAKTKESGCQNYGLSNKPGTTPPKGRADADEWGKSRESKHMGGALPEGFGLHPGLSIPT